MSDNPFNICNIILWFTKFSQTLMYEMHKCVCVYISRLKSTLYSVLVHCTHKYLKAKHEGRLLINLMSQS